MIKRIESGLASRGLSVDYLSDIKEKALKLGLVGIVFEKHDGSIKVIAEGEEENLKRLIRKLERGSFLSTTENFYVVWEDPTKEFSDFLITENK